MVTTFEQRRRAVLSGFALVSALLITAAVIWREELVHGAIWLFSDSLGAIILLAFVSSVLTLRAKRRLTITSMRRTSPTQAARSAVGAPSQLGAKILLLAVATIILLLIWSRVI